MASRRAELARKSVHVGMGGFALAIRWLGPWWSALAALGAFLFNLLLLHRLTRRALLRDTERARGFSWGIALYPAVVLAVILIFHRRLELAAALWGLLAFGDGMATVAGVTIGGARLPWNRDKSWAGLVSFVVYGTVSAAFLIRWTQQAVLDGTAAAEWVGGSFLATGSAEAVLPALLFLVLGCFVAALVAGFAESLDTGIDDNVIVPLVGGVVLYSATLVEPGRLLESGDVLLTNALWGGAINGALAVLAFAARGVGPSGAIWGWVLGTALYTLAGWPGFLMLLVFFVLGTGTTKLGYAKKAALGIAQEKGGRRGARNAFANTSAGLFCAFLAASTGSVELFSVALAAAFATAACDTVSSEIGQAYGRRHFLVTTFRRVRPGTEGAVSLEGTVAGILGALSLALIGYGVGLVPGHAVWIVVAAAFFGATFESYLGAAATKPEGVDNELINFTNTAVGAGAACLLFVLTASP